MLYGDNTVDALGLASLAQSIHSGAQSAAFHAARLVETDRCFQAGSLEWADALGTYDMGGELPHAGHTEAQADVVEWSEFLRSLA